ncbi:hypothetical protein EZV73_13440 [Acidaminobacter sp. JC074]|uniref:ABC transporter substrate-binding protein n=1 Tax=Acidaminobacter sp. JC074 TaxID=2530199 RepID=UPI001F10A705|nr:ABC transporter substrate-binding protein [Acidaminobacter sp. JC074]MCH4888590.1 hypothetical protein [Acidaminobacter sp. JC074]
MKLMKQLLILTLVFALTFSMISCSNNNETNTGDAGGNSTNAGSEEAVELTEEVLMVKEAPMLTDLVEKGELPALEKRLPVDAMVETDVQSLGEYGGSVEMTYRDSGHWDWGPLTEQSLFRFKSDGSGQVEANVCKAFYPNEDSTVWTIELREGMKWSDGQPLTADDFEFYYNHMSVPALNEDRSPLSSDDEAYYNAFTSKPYRAYYVTIDGVNYWAEFEKIDDYKYTMTFAAPKPDFPESVAIDNKWAVAPKHFFKQIVSRKDGVTDDASFPFITEEEAVANANSILGKEYDSYSTMGKKTGYYNWDHYQIPQLRSFIATENNWNKVGETYKLVRNPYFFKTDSEGRQLPYLDAINVAVINEQDQVVLKAIAGELDVYEIQPADFSTIASSTKDTHRISSNNSAEWGDFVLSLNQTVKDEDKRALFQSKDFRQALSIAVDRELLNATLRNNQADPRQLSPAEGMLGYDADWASKWTEYDVAKANSILDGLTEAWDKTEGTYRKMKGTDKDVELAITISEREMELNGDYIGLLTSAYKQIGIKVIDQVQSDVAQLILANEHEVTLDRPSSVSPALRPDSMLPMRNYMGWYGAYGKWYEDNKSTENGGVEPSGDMLALVEAYDAIRAAAGPERTAIVEENVNKIYELHKDNVWVIGFLSAPKRRFLVANDLKNFPDNMAFNDEYRWVNIFRPEQWYKVSK